MKRKVFAFLCALMMCLQPVALADQALSIEKIQSTLSQYSIEELLLLKEMIDEALEQQNGARQTFVVNKNTQKFHFVTCSRVKKMKEENKAVYNGEREMLIFLGFAPCGNCHP